MSLKSSTATQATLARKCTLFPSKHETLVIYKRGPLASKCVDLDSICRIALGINILQG